MDAVRKVVEDARFVPCFHVDATAREAPKTVARMRGFVGV